MNLNLESGEGLLPCAQVTQHGDLHHHPKGNMGTAPADRTTASPRKGCRVQAGATSWLEALLS